MSSSSIPHSRCCSVCKQEKPLTSDYFHKDSRASSGYSYACKECAKARSRKWVADNSDRNKANCKDWHANNMDKVRAYKEKIKPERKEKRKPSEKRYRQRKKEHRREYNRKYVAEHREWSNGRSQAWRERNPEKVKQVAHRRRTAEGKHTADDIRLLYELQDERCAYCGITLHSEYHLDHMMPVSRGGSNWPDNLALTCADCNLSKGAKTLDEWTAMRGW